MGITLNSPDSLLSLEVKLPEVTLRAKLYYVRIQIRQKK